MIFDLVFEQLAGSLLRGTVRRLCGELRHLIVMAFATRSYGVRSTPAAHLRRALRTPRKRDKIFGCKTNQKNEVYHWRKQGSCFNFGRTNF